uniref:Uncharacterized protein n=1 Tax=Parascaris univalens TaxID=6257 RepID=A0A915BDZ4_PARUN
GKGDSTLSAQKSARIGRQNVLCFSFDLSMSMSLCQLCVLQKTIQTSVVVDILCLLCTRRECISSSIFSILMRYLRNILFALERIFIVIAFGDILFSHRNKINFSHLQCY